MQKGLKETGALNVLYSHPYAWELRRYADACSLLLWLVLESRAVEAVDVVAIVGDVSQSTPRLLIVPRQSVLAYNEYSADDEYTHADE